jgi:hypothetical protein
MFDLIVSVYSRLRRWLIAAGLVLLWCGGARADWQVQEWNGEAWAPATTPKGRTVAVNIEKTACDLDLASLSMVKPSGTRLRCHQTPRPAPRP